MNFLERIFQRFTQTPTHPVIQEIQSGQEIRDGHIITATCAELLTQIRIARTFIRQSGLNAGDRCGLLAPNSIRWAAMDLALMAEGIIVVPLYARQDPSELANMLKDCGAAMVVCANPALRDGIAKHWPDGTPSLALFDDAFTTPPDNGIKDEPNALNESDIVTIIYTSGTSG